MIKKQPLFSLELTIEQNHKIGYNTQVSHFEDVVTKAIDNCIIALQEIPQIHVFVMDRLKWSTHPNIAAVALDEPLVQNLKLRVKVHIHSLIYKLMSLKLWL